MTREHRVSRRALLGAACALPIGCLPGPIPEASLLSPASESRWITRDRPEPACPGECQGSKR